MGPLDDWGLKMLRVTVLCSILMTGQAIASSECDAAGARWAELMPQGTFEDMAGRSWSEVVVDTDHRWPEVVSAWIGANLVLQAAHEDGTKADKRIAELVLTGDTLENCWRPEVANGTSGQQEMLVQFDEVYSAEWRAMLRSWAETIMKDGS